MNKLPTVEELVEKLQAADLEVRRYIRDTETCPAYSKWFHFTANYLLLYLKQDVWAEETKSTWIPTVKNQLIPKGTHVRQEWLDEQGQPRATEWVTHANSYLGGGRQQTLFIKVKPLTEEEQQLRDLRTVIGEKSDAQEILAAFKEKWDIIAKA